MKQMQRVINGEENCCRSIAYRLVLFSRYKTRIMVDIEPLLFWMLKLDLMVDI